MGLLIFQNEVCLVINKPPGESSETPSLDGVHDGKIFPVHRLDTPVSGCLLLAKNKRAAAFLSAAFSGASGSCVQHKEDRQTEGQGRVKKRYWAIIEKPKGGTEIPAEAELVHWIKENRKTNKSFALPAPERGAVKAVMRYKLTGQGDNYLFLEIDLVTGRHHQIRAQLAAEGLYVKGDLKYGAKRSEKQGGIRLHAYSLAFPNPVHLSETILVKALPPVMDSLWEAFQGFIIL